MPAANMTIEVAQLKANCERTILLYLTNSDGQSASVIPWDSADPALKRAALSQGFDPLRLLQHREDLASCSVRSCLRCA